MNCNTLMWIIILIVIIIKNGGNSVFSSKNSSSYKSATSSKSSGVSNSGFNIDTTHKLLLIDADGNIRTAPLSFIKDEIDKSQTETEEYVNSNFYTKTQTNDGFYTKTQTNDGFYTKTQTNDGFYTKTQTNDKFYTKTQTDASYIKQNSRATLETLTLTSNSNNLTALEICPGNSPLAVIEMNGKAITKHDFP